MFPDLSLVQIAIVLLVALIVYGPTRLPELGRQVGRGMRELRKHATSMGEDLNRALDEPSPEPRRGPSPSPEPDEEVLDGVVVDGAQTPDAIEAEDDLLDGVVVSGDTPPR